MRSLHFHFFFVLVVEGNVNAGKFDGNLRSPVDSSIHI